MKEKEVTLRMDLTSHQLRGLTVLTRRLGLLDIARITTESEELACIVSALAQLQCALSSDSALGANNTGVCELSASERAGKQPLKGLEVILRAASVRGEFKDNG